MKKGILVGVTTKYDEYDIEYSMAELKRLCETADIEALAEITQNLNAPTAAYYVGKGKIDDIKMAINTYDAEIVVFNDELSPAQIRNIQNLLDVEIIDRSLLILEIFALRAQTKEAQLEIALARKQYLLPRISFLREKESRSGGASGAMSSKGAGETQKELDRRSIMMEILQIKKELVQTQKMKTAQINKRKNNEIPIVALVGYTNAGKSSTMNAIMNFTKLNAPGKDVYVKDELFATLNTYNRLITYKKNRFILVDTVGFVSKLPHHLIQSFHQTLEEIKNADLIIEVVDSASIYKNTEISITESVLENLGVQDKDRLFLLNKADLNEERYELPGKKYLNFSSKTNENMSELLDFIVDNIALNSFDCKLLIPYSDGKIANFIEENAQIKAKVYQNDGIYYDIVIPAKYYKKIAFYEIGNEVN